MKPRIAIIGAGIAGMTLAHGLKNAAAVTVFEKSRGIGGRMATRREGDFAFDHGTQYFTGRSRPFREFLAPFLKKGTVIPWEGRVVTIARGKEPSECIWFEPHYVAAPSMNALCKALAKGITVTTETEITSVTRTKEDWELNGKTYDWVISTAPAPQTVTLLDSYLPKDHPLRSAKLQGCYAVMVGLDTPWKQDWIGAKFEGSPLGWASANHTKPGREGSTSLVLHSTNAWAEAHMNDDLETVQKTLLAEFSELAGVNCTKPTRCSTHRWRYALVENPSKSGFYCDPAGQLAAVGDWSVTSRIEEVWFTATELAEKIRGAL